MNGISYLPSLRPNSPFSAATRIGNVLYLSGQIGNQPDGTLPDGIAEQSRRTMENVAAVLARAGLGFEHVFKCTVMLAGIELWPEFNRVYVGYFDPQRLPSRSGFGCNGLVGGALVELECWALVPDGQ